MVFKNSGEMMGFGVRPPLFSEFFNFSCSSLGVEGLGILKGEILRIPDCPGLKIPHMGWNSLKLQNDGRLFKDLPEEPYVYFVHSYYLKATDESIVKATTGHCLTRRQVEAPNR